MLRINKQTNRQTDKQKTPNIPTPTNRVGVGKEFELTITIMFISYWPTRRTDGRTDGVQYITRPTVTLH